MDAGKALSAKAPGQVDVQFNMVEDNVNALGVSLEKLYERLSPVMNPFEKPSCPLGEEPPKEVLAPLADRLRILLERVNGMRERAESVRNRLEI